MASASRVHLPSPVIRSKVVELAGIKPFPVFRANLGPLRMRSDLVHAAKRIRWRISHSRHCSQVTHTAMSLYAQMPFPAPDVSDEVKLRLFSIYFRAKVDFLFLLHDDFPSTFSPARRMSWLPKCVYQS